MVTNQLYAPNLMRVLCLGPLEALYQVVGTIVTVFVLVEVARNAWIYRRRHRNSGQ